MRRLLKFAVEGKIVPRHEERVWPGAKQQSAAAMGYEDRRAFGIMLKGEPERVRDSELGQFAHPARVKAWVLTGWPPCA